MHNELIKAIDDILDDDAFFRRRKLELLLNVLEILGTFKTNKMLETFYLRKYPILEIGYFDYLYYAKVKIGHDTTWDITFDTLSSDEITTMLKLCYNYATFGKRRKTC